MMLPPLSEIMNAFWIVAFLSSISVVHGQSANIIEIPIPTVTLALPFLKQNSVFRTLLKHRLVARRWVLNVKRIVMSCPVGHMARMVRLVNMFWVLWILRSSDADPDMSDDWFHLHLSRVFPIFVLVPLMTFSEVRQECSTAIWTSAGTRRQPAVGTSVLPRTKGCFHVSMQPFLSDKVIIINSSRIKWSLCTLSWVVQRQSQQHIWFKRTLSYWTGWRINRHKLHSKCRSHLISISFEIWNMQKRTKWL